MMKPIFHRYTPSCDCEKCTKENNRFAEMLNLTNEIHRERENGNHVPGSYRENVKLHPGSGK